MYGRGHGKPFNKQHLVDSHSEQTAQYKPARIFPVEPDFIFCKKPKCPEQDEASADTKKIKRIRSDQ